MLKRDKLEGINLVILLIFSFISLLTLISCEPPPYPPPKTQGVIKAESQYGVYDKDGVYYDSCGNSITLSMKITSIHRVDSAFLKIKWEGGGEILLKSYRKGDIIDTAEKTWFWDTVVTFWCPAIVLAEVEMCLDNAEVRTGSLKMVIRNRSLNLKNLIVEGIELNEPFKENVYNYNSIVENEISLVKITPFTEGNCLKITINKDTVISGESKEYFLLVGENRFEIKSIMPEGKEKVYTLILLRRESRSETRLKKVEIGGNILSENDSIYILEVDNLLEEILIACESKNERAIIKIVNGDSAIGSLSVKKKLKVGNNEVIIKVISEDGNNSKEYKINIIRKAAEIQRLKKIEFSVGILQPKFNPDTFNYRLLLQEVDSIVDLNIESEDSKSKVTINGEEIRQKSIIFKNEFDSVFIEVISWDSSSSSLYKIYLEKIKSNDAGLSNLTFTKGTLYPEFNSEVTKYKLAIKSTDTIVGIKVEPRHNKAKVVINGEELKEKSFSIVKDTDSVLVKVISEDGKNTKEYKIIIEKIKSNNATLRELILVPSGMLNPPSFDPEIKDYTLTVADSVETLMVKAVPSSNYATVKINTLSNPAKIFLKAGEITPVNIIVKAEDGITTETYRILVTRSTSDIAILSNVILSTGELIPSFNSEIRSYEIAVSSKTESIKIKPVRGHSRSTVTVNGNTVPYDSFSMAIPITSGQPTKIEVVVTSESGKNKSSYLFVVRKRYVVNILAPNSDSGKVEPSGSQKIYDGDSLKITATPSTGYHFLKWTKVSGNCNFTDSSKSVTYIKPVDDVVVRAVFEINKYQLTLSTDTKMGSVSGGGTVEHGKEVSIIATPISGYHFVKWIITEGKAIIKDSTLASTTVKLTEGNAKITAIFAINKYYLNVISDGNGTVSGSDSVEHNSTKTIKATPKEGYKFVKWEVVSGNGVIEDPTKSETTIKLTSHTTVKAIFELIKYYTLTLTDDGNGSVSGGGTFRVDSLITITAIPKNGYVFSQWKIENGNIFIEDKNRPTTKVKLIDGNVNIKAIFIKLNVLKIEVDNSMLDLSLYNIRIGTNVLSAKNKNGVEDSALYFTGDTLSYLEIPHDEIFDLSTKGFTFSMWIKPDTIGIPYAPPKWFGIIAKGVGEKEQFAFDIQQGSNKEWCYRYWVRDTSKYVSNSIIGYCKVDTNWHYVELVREKNEEEKYDSLSLYFDGTIVEKIPIYSEVLYRTTEPITIGTRKDLQGYYTYGFKGYISDVRIKIYTK